VSGTPTLTNKRDHADLPVKPSLVEPVHDKTPPMFQGTFQLHVLVASGFQGTADPQLRKTFGENVIVTETRVRIPLGPPFRFGISCLSQAEIHLAEGPGDVPANTSLKKGPTSYWKARVRLRLEINNALRVTDATAPLGAMIHSAPRFA